MIEFKLVQRIVFSLFETAETPNAVTYHLDAN